MASQQGDVERLAPNAIAITARMEEQQHLLELITHESFLEDALTALVRTESVQQRRGRKT